MGWADLAARFKMEGKFHGTRIGLISASINSSSYQNSLILKYNDHGIYLNPILPFRPFHPALFIPWTEVKEVREKKIFIITYKELIIGDPFIAHIMISAKTFNKVYSNTIQTNTSHQ